MLHISKYFGTEKKLLIFWFGWRRKNEHQRNKIILKQKIKRFKVYEIKNIKIIDRIWKWDKDEKDNNDESKKMRYTYQDK